MEGKAIYSDALTNLTNVLQIYTCILQMGVSSFGINFSELLIFLIWIRTLFECGYKVSF